MFFRTLFLSAGLLVSATVFAAGAGIDPAEMEALKTYCRADIERLCGNVEPGGGRIKQCLLAQKEQMSVGCAQALQKLKQEKAKAH